MDKGSRDLTTATATGPATTHTHSVPSVTLRYHVYLRMWMPHVEEKL